MLFVLLLGLVCLQQADRVLGEEIKGSGHNIPAILKRSSTIIFLVRSPKYYHVATSVSDSDWFLIRIRIAFHLHAEPDIDLESQINAD
jgi:hypothetical protein